MLIVGVNALDVELLGSTGQLEVSDERLLDLGSSPVIAAEGTLAFEVEHRAVREIRERAIQVSLRERRIGVAYSCNIRMFGHPRSLRGRPDAGTRASVTPRRSGRKGDPELVEQRPAVRDSPGQGGRIAGAQGKRGFGHDFRLLDERLHAGPD